jgi:hypothetical protein
MKVDFEISDSNGRIRANGVLPCIRVDRIEPARTFDCMGIVYEIPEQNVVQVMFGQKMLPIEDGETLTLFYHLEDTCGNELDGLSPGDCQRRGVHRDTDEAADVSLGESGGEGHDAPSLPPSHAARDYIIPFRGKADAAGNPAEDGTN